MNRRYSSSWHALDAAELPDLARMATGASMQGSSRRVQLRLIQGVDVLGVHGFPQGLSDLVCTITNRRTGEEVSSIALDNTVNPRWHQSFFLEDALPDDVLHLRLWSAHVMAKTRSLIGHAEVSVGVALRRSSEVLFRPYPGVSVDGESLLIALKRLALGDVAVANTFTPDVSPRQGLLSSPLDSMPVQRGVQTPASQSTSHLATPEAHQQHYGQHHSSQQQWPQQEWSQQQWPQQQLPPEQWPQQQLPQQQWPQQQLPQQQWPHQQYPPSLLHAPLQHSQTQLAALQQQNLQQQQVHPPPPYPQQRPQQDADGPPGPSHQNGYSQGLRASKSQATAQHCPQYAVPDSSPSYLSPAVIPQCVGDAPSSNIVPAVQFTCPQAKSPNCAPSEVPYGFGQGVPLFVQLPPSLGQVSDTESGYHEPSQPASSAQAGHTCLPFILDHGTDAVAEANPNSHLPVAPSPYLPLQLTAPYYNLPPPLPPYYAEPPLPPAAPNVDQQPSPGAPHLEQYPVSFGQHLESPQPSNASSSIVTSALYSVPPSSSAELRPSWPESQFYAPSTDAHQGHAPGEKAFRSRNPDCPHDNGVEIVEGNVEKVFTMQVRPKLHENDADLAKLASPKSTTPFPVHTSRPRGENSPGPANQGTSSEQVESQFVSSLEKQLQALSLPLSNFRDSRSGTPGNSSDWSGAASSYNLSVSHLPSDEFMSRTQLLSVLPELAYSYPLSLADVLPSTAGVSPLDTKGTIVLAVIDPRAPSLDRVVPSNRYKKFNNLKNTFDATKIITGAFGGKLQEMGNVVLVPVGNLVKAFTPLKVAVPVGETFPTFKIQMHHIKSIFGHVRQRWNEKHPAAQKIFQTPGARHVVKAQHAALYGGMGISSQRGTNIRQKLGCETGFILGGQEFMELIGYGARDGKPRMFTYVLMPERLYMCETGASVIIDFSSKHAMHSNASEEVVYAGEMHVRRVSVGDEQRFILVLDNNSGTYAPDATLLPELREVFRLNFLSLDVEVYDFRDDALKRLTDQVKNANS